MLTALLVLFMSAQAASAPACRVAAFDEVAFYSGVWRVTLNRRVSAAGAWERTDGRATIRAALMGCALVESLDSVREGAPLQVFSVLTHDRTAGRWQYSVTDSEHGRLQTYEGRREGGAFVLVVPLEIPGGRVLVRRTLTPVSADAFRWESARSLDEGRTWEVVSRFEYQRERPEPPAPV
jgi:hypothetical protein